MHIESTKEMLPWFYTYDHINYARYLPIYLVDMMSLEESHPEAHTMHIQCFPMVTLESKEQPIIDFPKSQSTKVLNKHSIEVLRQKEA